MIRYYSNEKIYKNFEAVHILSAFALALSIITISTYCILEYAGQFAFETTDIKIMFYIFVIIIPLNIFIYSLCASKKQDVQTVIESRRIIETEINNDLTATLIQIIVSFIPYILLLIFMFLYLCFGSPNFAGLAFLCGFMLPAHILVYIGDILLIKNCVYIKREWKLNPPDFEKEKIEAKQRKADERKAADNKALLEKCGMRFFIKYLAQIIQLPIRDIIVEENYTAEERRERLLAAKEIAKSDERIVFCLNYIITEFGKILKEEEIKTAKTYLAKYNGMQGPPNQ